jgi:hypothetical protein
MSRTTLLAALLFSSLSGCGSGNGSFAVQLAVSQAMNVSPTVIGFSSNAATVILQSDGYLHFGATAPQQTLTVVLLAPLHVGQTLDIAQDHNFLSFDELGAGWGSNAGSVTVNSVSPYNITMSNVQMLRGSAAAQGTFYFNGTGTFQEVH